MKGLKFLGLVLLSTLMFFMTACGKDAVQIGAEPTFATQQTQPSTAPTVSTPVATDPSEPTQPTEPIHVHAWCEATCTSAKTCTDCGATEGEMLEHSWDAGTVAKEATVTEEGEMLYTCTVCGEAMTQNIPSLNHEHTYTAAVTEPTCTKIGYTTYTCRCGDSYKSNTTAALQHQVNDWDVVKAPTCTDAGEECGTCQRCGTYQTRPVDAISGMYETSYAVIIAESVSIYGDFGSTKVVGTLHAGDRLLIYEQVEDNGMWARISEGKPYIRIGWDGGSNLNAEIPCDGWIRLDKKVEIEVVRTPYGHKWCSSLNSIYFMGTTEQWGTITFGIDWHCYSPATEVICSDGTVSFVDITENS